MEKFIKKQLENIEQWARNIVCSIQGIYGYCDGHETVARNFAQEANNNAPAPYYGNGYQEVISSNLIQEIKEMIIELKIKGSARQRSNGLVELRTQALGSIYGRSKAEIEQKFNEKLKEVSKGNKKKNTAPLLSEFYKENYLPYKINQARKENTIKGIESNFKYIMLQGFDKPLTAYKSKAVEDFLYQVKETRKRQVLQGLFNNMFNRAVALGIIKSNPCAPIEKMQHLQEQGTAMSFDEQLAFFDSLFTNPALTYKQKCYFIFVYLTGPRRNEALTVNVSDVDMNGKTLNIRGTKTTDSDRFIPLFPIVEKLLLSIDVDNNAFFDLSYNYVGKLFRKVSEIHRIHDLRHTFGTIQICVEKINPKTVSLWLGHKGIETTLKTYTHPEQLDKGTFLRGDLTEEEKISTYKRKYQEILHKIEGFLDSRTQIVPKK